MDNTIEPFVKAESLDSDGLPVAIVQAPLFSQIVPFSSDLASRESNMNVSFDTGCPRPCDEQPIESVATADKPTMESQRLWANTVFESAVRSSCSVDSFHHDCADGCVDPFHNDWPHWN